MFPRNEWMAANFCVLGGFVKLDDAPKLLHIILLGQLDESDAFSAGTSQRRSSRINGLRLSLFFIVVLFGIDFIGLFSRII